MILVPLLATGFFVGTYVWAETYAEGIIGQYQDEFLGKEISLLEAKLGRPNWIRLEHPKVLDASGKVIKEYDPYEVWYYSPWPRFIHCGPGLMVMVDKEGTINRFKDPLY